MSEIINTDSIGIIRSSGTAIRYEKISIPQKTGLLNELKDMCENPNRSIFDLASRINREFIEKERTFYNYISPYSYDSTYVSGTSFPEPPDFNEYKKKLEEKREACINSAEKIYKDFIHSPADFRELVDNMVSKEMELYEKQQKSSFYQRCERFCHAHSYTTLFNSLIKRPDIKMATSDQIGWREHEYQITKDVKINVHTNFGYGYSSYFYVTLKYKNIDILPYSFIVNYYYADKRDIARFTRLYETKHKSWNYALDFVEEVANKTINDEDSFVKKYIMNEVQEMIRGLKGILSDPHAFLNKMCTLKNMENESHYLTVRHMNDEEYEQFKIYPHEISIVFQAEKISGALKFLQKLAALKPIYNNVQEEINTIKDIAKQLLPRLISNIDNIANDIKRLTSKEEILTLEIERIDTALIPHEEEIETEYNNHEKAIPKYSIEEKYMESHPEYESLKNDRKELCDKKREIAKEIYNRSEFKSSLEKSKELIEKNSIEED